MQKNFSLNLFFVDVFEVNEENSRIRIRIRTKMSWIRNTALKTTDFAKPA